MKRIVLYTKAGCHLCDEAREHLEDLAADYEFDLAEIDIRSDDTLFERYRYRIPVIVIDGTIELETPIREPTLRRALR